MKIDDFQISQEFYTNAGMWRCTDIGTRVIIAIALNQVDVKNYNGPPYSIQEIVFYEYDFDGCFTQNITNTRKDKKKLKRLLGF